MNSNDAKRVSDEIFNIINRQFTKVMNNNPNFYSGYKLIISDEQSFVLEDDRETNNIYAVIKFLPSTLLFGQYVQNITIDVISEHNGIEVSRTLLSDYALMFNLQAVKTGNLNIKQVYTTPTATSTFNEVFDGYRATFSLSGTYLVSDNAYAFDLYYEGQKVECINNSFDFNITPNTQPYFNSDNFTRTHGEFGTLTIGFVSYLTKTPLLDKCLNVAFRKLDREPNGVDTPFTFTLKFEDNNEIKDLTFKLIRFVSNQTVGDIPSCSLTFTE